MGILCTLLWLYLAALIARMVFSWISVPSGSLFESVASAVYGITEPVLGPLRRAIPPVRAGAVGIDLSITIVIIGIYVLMGLIGC